MRVLPVAFCAKWKISNELFMNKNIFMNIHGTIYGHLCRFYKHEFP